ncbi:uncharacterized protein LOC118375006 [Oncorhynchus keta]|uniref:uncharacterized protein LOC118375006 n=1 Tax=Oncorhynchus keta TaxID=8018 RepID=UPI0015FCAF81|nr:uncharacterized protein LOC118375006 [Oncorhynchus keta]
MPEDLFSRTLLFYVRLESCKCPPAHHPGLLYRWHCALGRRCGHPLGSGEGTYSCYLPSRTHLCPHGSKRSAVDLGTHIALRWTHRSLRNCSRRFSDTMDFWRKLSPTWRKLGPRPASHPGTTGSPTGMWRGPTRSWGGSLELTVRTSRGSGPGSFPGGAVRPELTLSLLHRSDSLPVRPGISAGPGPMDNELDRGPCCGQVVPAPGGLEHEVTFCLQHTNNNRISPSFHVSLLKTVDPCPLADAVPCNTYSPPLDINRTPAYAVRSLLDSQRCGGRLQYLKNWGTVQRNAVGSHLRCLNRPAPRPCGHPPG